MLKLDGKASCTVSRSIGTLEAEHHCTNPAMRIGCAKQYLAGTLTHVSIHGEREHLTLQLANIASNLLRLGVLDDEQ